MLISPRAGSAREFTSTNGKKMEAEVVSVDSGTAKATLKRSDGKTFTVELAKLSETDRTFLKEWEKAHPQIRLNYKFNKVRDSKDRARDESGLASEDWHFEIVVENLGFDDLEQLKVEYELFSTLPSTTATPKVPNEGRRSRSEQGASRFPPSPIPRRSQEKRSRSRCSHGTFSIAPPPETGRPSGPSPNGERPCRAQRSRSSGAIRRSTPAATATSRNERRGRRAVGHFRSPYARRLRISSGGSSPRRSLVKSQSVQVARVHPSQARTAAGRPAEGGSASSRVATEKRCKLAHPGHGQEEALQADFAPFDVVNVAALSPEGVESRRKRLGVRCFLLRSQLTAMVSSLSVCGAVKVHRPMSTTVP